MENTTMNSTGSIMGSLLIFVVIILIVYYFIGGGNPRNGFEGRPYDNGCGCVSNCELQKQEIIDNYRNFTAIDHAASKTIDVDNANTREILNQNSRIYEAGLQEKIFDLKLNDQTAKILSGQELIAKDAEIAALKTEIAFDRRFGHLSAEIGDIRCNMLVKPQLFGQAYYCDGTGIPSTTTTA